MNAMDAIIDAALAALRAAPAVTTGPIDEDIDQDELGEAVQQAVSLSLTNTDPNGPAPILGHPQDWISTLVIECYARRDERSSSGRASRLLASSVYHRLMADPTLGGACDDLRQPTLATEINVTNTRIGRTTVSIPVWHRTRDRSLESPTP